jgi:hypothetical protein
MTPLDESRRPSADPASEGRRAPDANGGVRLGEAAGEELKRVATQPAEEAERIKDEVREGRSGTGLFALVGGIALSVWFIAALLMTAVFLVAYFLAR